MGVLDKDMIAINSKPWLVSLICAIFVIYPNAAWFFCDLSFLSPNDHVSFCLFSLFRFVFIWSLTSFLIIYNFRYLSTPYFLSRLGVNLLFTFCGLLLYKMITHFVCDFDRFLSILIFQFIVICLLSALIGHICQLYIYQREKEQEIECLRVENLKSRCNALANQVNPHFFFNALNGISSLIRKKNDSNTLIYVTKLSDIFRYILQSDKKGLVTLSEELEFVDAFRHVMEVRFANKLIFKIEVAENMRALRIPVLSLLPLLENVTVHNIIDSEHRMEVYIHLNEYMELVVSNPLYPKLAIPETNGTGLKNLENRFALMMDNKKIRIESDKKMFRVYLPLK